MRFHIHRWSKWEPIDQFIDTSYGDEVLSTLTVRRCDRCGLYERKGLYGVVLPIPEETR